MTDHDLLREAAELKPCPFCGGPAEMSWYARGAEPARAGYFVECLSCSASGQRFEIQGEMPDREAFTQEQAIAAWNTRTAADHAPSEAQVRDGVLDDAIRVCREQEMAFLDPQYAHPQPMGSFSERFACGEIIRALEALKSPATTSKEGG